MVVLGFFDLVLHDGTKVALIGDFDLDRHSYLGLLDDVLNRFLGFDKGVGVITELTHFVYGEVGTKLMISNRDVCECSTLMTLQKK